MRCLSVSATREGMYVGIGLCAVGLVIGVTALPYGKGGKSEKANANVMPEEATESL